MGAEIKLCDIRLLSSFIVNETAEGFDLIASNGRSEALKLTYREGTSIDSQQPVLFKVSQKVQFTAAQ